MVHALEKVHSLLQPRGVMIDVQEIPYWRWLGVLGNEGVRLIKSHTSSKNYTDNRQAFAAMASVIDQGLFALDDERTFDAYTHADTVDDLVEYFTSPISEKTIQSLKALLERAGSGAKVVVRQPTRMVRLQAV
ncbi:MAG: hypothetical protein FVQ83_14740 [Chloroflexi bacterium]|nr:hypothetical protein [Chloroflexota bacterium]